MFITFSCTKACAPCVTMIVAKLTNNIFFFIPVILFSLFFSFIHTTIIYYYNFVYYTISTPFAIDFYTILVINSWRKPRMFACGSSQSHKAKKIAEPNFPFSPAISNSIILQIPGTAISLFPNFLLFLSALQKRLNILC